MTSAREASESAAPGAGPDDLLPLPSLSIRELRGIEELSIPRLGPRDAARGPERDGQDDGARRGTHLRVPLKSLGDGAVRLLGVALALANSRDGFLQHIDEAENGIHHAVQRDFWRMVLQTARDNNVQVLATTHGWDCVRGFAQAARELGAVDEVLVRLERRGDRIRALEYPEEELIVAARQEIEVR